MDKDVRIAELESEVRELKRLLFLALDEIARLKKNSSTSSKPPSSDIVKPPKCATGSNKADDRRKKRKPGGQSGHAKHSRSPFSVDQVDHAYAYDWHDPGPDWQPLDDFHILQQVDLRENPLIVTEHRFRRYRHRTSGRITHAPAPESLRRQGLVGPRLRAATAVLKGQCHVSYRSLQAFYRDVLGLALSTGQLAKIIGQTSEALAQPYADLHARLAGEPVLNLDETGHPQRGQNHWLWCAVAKKFTVFKAAASRGAQVIEGLLGLAYSGVVGSDFFSAYHKFVKQTGCLASYCWAHLIRDIRYLTTFIDSVTVNWATKLLGETKRLFRAYHTQGQRAQGNAKAAILERVRRPPPRTKARVLANRIRTNAEAYFRFLEHNDVEPTNNQAERALRHAVIDRRITQGTRGDTGSRWLERFLTVRETCRQQDRSLFEYLLQAISQHTAGKTIPTLMA